MDVFEKKLNELLMNTFKGVMKIEEKVIRKSQRSNLSINEMHILEDIGRYPDGEVTVSLVSQLAEITLPSATVAVNKLVNKGYLTKEKCADDGRVTYVKLTDLGRKMNRVHSYFHYRMVRDVTKELSEEEKDSLIRGIEKLNNFFKKSLEVNKK